MPVRSFPARCGLTLLSALGVVLAALGGVSLGAAGLGVVVLTAVAAACLGAGIAREGGHRDPHRAAVEAAWRTAVGTVATLLVLSGSIVLIGPGPTALAVVAALGGLLLRWVVRSARADRRTSATAAPGAGVDRRPVQVLSVQQLGREWVHTSAALAGAPGPVGTAALVRRRQEALDELERRDPAGFARWLDGGATVDSDPADHVSGGPAGGSGAL